MKQVLIGILLAGWALQGGAQPVPVVDAGAQNESPSRNAGNATPQTETSIVMELYMQLEALQREVQNLRGIVEEQSYQIQRMQQQQEDRYLDLDRRLSQLVTGEGLPPSGGNGQQTANRPPPSPRAQAVNPDIPTTVGTGRSTAAAPQNEQDLYRQALDTLLNESNYEQAINLFQQYIDRHPGGRYITNAYYWLGEALILVERYQEAEQAFTKVINDYPQDPKAAGAMLKLGVVYERTGMPQLARQTWQDLIEEYPESATEIRTAREYLNRGAQ